MDRRRLHPEDYTVGWVCALPLELAAARAMLDEEHRDPPRQPHETNVYCLGRISEHNVVIMCLPAGQYGTNSAAASTARMTEKFRSIRFCLMVGIGGGVPSEETDVRLGDVVISQPQAQYGGVVQYDLGKIEADGRTVRTGYLNPPPTVLLNALSKFRSAGQDQACNILAHISSPATPHRFPTVKKPESDTLVKKRATRDQGIQIHYGTIASGNQVVKDGIMRDKMSRELGGVLCFEMEAAGLMNILSCLVIRGICDYSDSHKNKKWQQYAAIVAASCAKELLGMVPPAETLENPPQKDVRARLEALLLTDPTIDREHLISTKGARVAGTCEWICKNELYHSWLQSSTRLLWICGGPGKGKTMLSIFLTEELEKFTQEDEDKELVFFFCSNQDEKRNTAVAILSGLVYQIIKKRPNLIKHAEAYFDTEERARITVSSVEALWIIFRKIIQDPDIGTTFCILDGLDECDQDSRSLLGAKFAELFPPNGPRTGTGGFKLIIVSREIHALRNFPRVRLDPDFDEQVTSDIEHFVSVRVQELSRLDGFNDRLRTHVKSILLERAEGTFLWVGFVMNELLQKKTCTEVLETLEALPSGLPGIYSRMLLGIEGSQQEVCSRILRWVTMALRPLTLQELAAAIGTQSSDLISGDQAIRDQIAFCGPFIKIDKQEVGLIHQSARDYLLRENCDSNPILETFRINAEETHFQLAQACLDCIGNSRLRYVPLHSLDAPQDPPLLSYAVFHWPEHARCSAYTDAIFDTSRPFFQKKSPLRSNWCKAYGNHLSNIRNVPLIHIASYFGITSWAQKLLARKFRLHKLANKKDSSGRTPLIYGAITGHEAIIRLLLDRGADVNATDEYGWTAPHWAAILGHEATVRLLLDRGADANAIDENGWTALHRAAFQGHKAIVRLLLDRGADANAIDKARWTALHRAANEGHKATVRLLLDRGADANAIDKARWTALHRAAFQGYKAIVRLLLDGGADANAIDKYGRTPLIYGAIKGHEAIIRLLLDRGADVNATDEYGRTPLIYGAIKGHEAMIRLLLDRGADANAIDENGLTALHWAASQGHEATVQLLLDRGADANATWGNNNTTTAGLQR
ncbi:uncharacterized protein N7482_004803 [Penicillium canariense]|uniref:NACHT domain-containing protein n=1 Tax=Penicillium canariense TaxID=189055 RepID=A0A9W9LPQ8_9EURO|nr:uncharacterized protein N7482_004803 [Penicillium canariense]KAJ5169209.1 hypothetical protein N7482_004803 [Penicillium canariense]